MTKLEILRNTLLVTLLIMLAYILYKRLLHIFKKQNISTDYPELSNQLRWIDPRHAVVSVKLPQRTHLHVRLHKADGEMLLQIADGDFETGIQEFNIDATQLDQGRYYYAVSSPRQEASQYFDIA